MVAAFEAGQPLPESFDALACDLARHQAANIEGYARLCRARGLDLGALASAADIPAVPTDAFKMTRVATFEASNHPLTARAMNSGPLSLRRWPGQPRSANSFASTATTSLAVIRRATTSTRHSRVNSSTIGRIFSRRGLSHRGPSGAVAEQKAVPDVWQQPQNPTRQGE